MNIRISSRHILFQSFAKQKQSCRSLLCAAHSTSHNAAKTKSANISKFYENSNVLVTGATGFVGSSLVEKLLWSCSTVENIYLIVRPKRNVPAEERLNELFKLPLFDRIRKTDPQRLKKVKVLAGEVSQVNFGLGADDRKLVQEKVNIVFHCAAIIKFQDALKSLVETNVCSINYLVDLCKDMRDLKGLIYVSTAYSNFYLDNIDEIIYDPPYDPQFIIKCVEALPSDVVDLISPQLIKKFYNNAYTFSKCLGEHLVSTHSKSLPIAIVRPSAVLSSWKEPFPGWFYGNALPAVEIAESMTGGLRNQLVDGSIRTGFIPIDFVVNTLIAAAWYSGTSNTSEMKIYNCTSSQVNEISWDEFRKLAMKYAIRYPTKHVVLYPSLTYTTNRFVHNIYQLFHFSYAYIADISLYCTKRKPRMVKTYRGLTNLWGFTQAISLREVSWHNENFKALTTVVEKAEDGEHFTMDMSTDSGFDWDKYMEGYILGIRKHVLEDDVSSLEDARVKLRRVYWASKAVQVVFISAVLGSLMW